MATVASGQITIIDYNDAITLTSFISSNNVKTQIYNPDNSSYTPNWAANPYLVLTPSLFKAGSTTDIITSAKSITWYDGAAPTVALTANSTYAIATVANKGALTVKANTMTTVNAKDYICEIVYTDPTTGLDVATKSTISFSKIQNGEGIVAAVAVCEDGNIFKNNDVVSLTATCDLYRGGTADTTSVTYQWYKQDPSQNTNHAGIGTGWLKLTNQTNMYANCTTRKLTIYPNAVTNVAVFACTCTDTDTSSGTYNQIYKDTVTIIDNTDPYSVIITSTGGDVFKNGTGSTTLTAHIYQAGKEVDANGTDGFTYTWTKYSNSNVKANFYGTSSPTKTGKSLSITGDDVDVKNTFICEVSR